MYDLTRNRLNNLINEFGDNGELHTFEACSEAGIELEGSTIDKIAYRADGKLIFTFNENLPADFAMENEFSDDNLEQFANELDEYFREPDKASVRDILDEAMRPVISDPYDRSTLVDNILNDIINDMVETADDDWNNDDVLLSLSRVLLALSEMGK